MCQRLLPSEEHPTLGPMTTRQEGSGTAPGVLPLGSAAEHAAGLSVDANVTYGQLGT